MSGGLWQSFAEIKDHLECRLIWSGLIVADCYGGLSNRHDTVKCCRRNLVVNMSVIRGRRRAINVMRVSFYGRLFGQWARHVRLSICAPFDTWKCKHKVVFLWIRFTSGQIAYIVTTTPFQHWFMQHIISNLRGNIVLSTWTCTGEASKTLMDMSSPFDFSRLVRLLPWKFWKLLHKSLWAIDWFWIAN